MVVECVRSLSALDYPDLEVLVVDQSATEETLRAVENLESADPRIRALGMPSLGASAARNLGAQVSTAEIVAYTDDDCVVDVCWVRSLVREFADPDVGAVYGRLLAADVARPTGTEVAFKPTRERGEFTGRMPPWHVGHGANVAVRRSVLLEVGGFDVMLGAGAHFEACEDADLTYRLLIAGWRAVYAGDALAYHRQWRSWRERRRTERRYGVGAGALFSKHVRMGDLYGLRLFATWSWELGVRRIGAGLIKWRDPRPIYLGYCQLVYPWLGVGRSLCWPIDRGRRVYVGR